MGACEGVCEGELDGAALGASEGELVCGLLDGAVEGVLVVPNTMRLVRSALRFTAVSCGVVAALTLTAQTRMEAKKTTMVTLAHPCREAPPP